MKICSWLSILTVLVLILSGIQTVNAEIIPARGEGQIGLQAVVLCNTLTVRKEPSGTAKAVKTLQYGALPIVTKQEGGWAYCVLGDSENSPSGWINMDYILIDPSWYKTDDKTPVYAWYDTASPKVALLDKGTTLPILKDEGDWLIVSLRGATGWIRKTGSDASSASAQWSQPERQNGERFEAVIIIEGMEETVRYEHVANDSLGIEIDFDYDLFVRYSAADHERFVSRFDDPAGPAIYLEVTHRQEGAEAVFATLSEELAKEYHVTSETSVLERAGGCIRIDAYEDQGSRGTDRMQTVYIIPSAQGCFVAASHYTVESAEGFGVRFDSMINTLVVNK